MSNIAQYIRNEDGIPFSSIDFTEEFKSLNDSFNVIINSFEDAIFIRPDSLPMSVFGDLKKVLFWQKEQEVDSIKFLCQEIKKELPNKTIIVLPLEIGFEPYVNEYTKDKYLTPEPRIASIEHRLKIRYIAINVSTGVILYDAKYFVDIQNISWIMQDKTRLYQYVDELANISKNYLYKEFNFKTN